MTQRILFVLTSHDRKGPAGADAAPCDFYLSELTHPHPVLAEAGARHVPAANFQAQVVVSERLVTGQNPASAKGVAEAMLPLLAVTAEKRA